MAGPENNKEACNLDGAIRQTAQGKDISAKFGGIKSKILGSSDLYDRPGETKAADTSSGPTWAEKLLGKPLMEGDGPLARVARGESITEAERADLEKNRLIYTPRDKTQ